MITTAEIYPEVQGSVDATNELNGAFHVWDGTKTGPHDFFEQSTLAYVDSKELLRELRRSIGENPDREGLQQTPARIICSWNELFGGYRQRAEDVLITSFMLINTMK